MLWLFSPHDEPSDELTSCSDLLTKDFFRMFLWIFAFLSLIGNAGVLCYRLCIEKKTDSQRSFRVLVLNLCAADRLMGVYMMIIGAADTVYRGVYVEEEDDWTGSVACTVAGVLSFVSSEVSAFVLCLITLDRVLAICFFKPRFRLGLRATVTLCILAWATGLTLAVAPLMSGMEFYGVNGICIPLPITQHKFGGQGYAFAVFICLNFVLFIFIGGGQLAICRAVRNSGSRVGQGSTEMDVAVTRRLLLIAATDFMCWFPIGLMGILATNGVPVPVVVNVWTAIFVLPFNSVLNPFLYTLNTVLQRWQNRRCEAHCERTLGRLQTEIPKWSPRHVEQLIDICVRSKLLDDDLLRKYFNRHAKGSISSSTTLSELSERSESTSTKNKTFNKE